MKTVFYSFWLIPREPNPFQAVVDRLAVRFNTVPFSAHLTLCSCDVPLSFEFIPFLLNLNPSGAPIALNVVEIASEEQFSKSLFVRFKTHADLRQLVGEVVASVPNAIAPTLDPHISLLYHSLTATQKADLLSEITISQSEVIFDKVQVIAAPRVFETQEHVAQLRCLYQKSLLLK